MPRQLTDINKVFTITLYCALVRCLSERNIARWHCGGWPLIVYHVSYSLMIWDIWRKLRMTNFPRACLVYETTSKNKKLENSLPPHFCICLSLNRVIYVVNCEVEVKHLNEKLVSDGTHFSKVKRIIVILRVLQEINFSAAIKELSFCTKIKCFLCDKAQIIQRNVLNFRFTE